LISMGSLGEPVAATQVLVKMVGSAVVPTFGGAVKKKKSWSFLVLLTTLSAYVVIVFGV